MTDRVAVVTANLGGFDAVHGQAPQTVDADWWYLADRDLGVPPPWNRFTSVEPPGAFVPNFTGIDKGDPRLTAKRFRMTPWETIGGDYRWIVWVDASTQVTNPDFLKEALAAADGHVLTAWRHPRRDTIRQECEMSLVESHKYDAVKDRMEEQIAFYYAAGFADVPPLAATGTLVWRNCDEARALGELWLANCERWTVQDQLSLPYVCWLMGVDLGYFPHLQVDRRYGYGKARRGPGNVWLRYMDHTRPM